MFGRELDLGLAATSACVAGVTALSDVTTQIVGVPLPVLMAAAAGAFVVIAFAEMAAMKAAAVFAALMIAGCAGSPLLEAAALWAAQRWVTAEFAVPGGIKAFAALAIAAAPLWLPRVPAFVRAVLELWAAVRRGSGGGAQ